MASSETPLAAAAEHRSRLLEGMARATAERGYALTTIADVVREAGVSRRTFYEHFATRAECLIALYETASRHSLAVLRGAIDPAHEWQTQVERALAAYLVHIAQNPVLLRSLYIEILGLGAEGLAARRRVNDEIVQFVLEVANGRKGAGKRGASLSPEMATAVVGGINELILQAVEGDCVDRLEALAAPAGALVRAVTRTAG